MASETIYTLFRSTPQSYTLKAIVTGSWDRVWAQAQTETRKHPRGEFLIRSSRTGDGGEHIRQGHAYGRLVRQYEGGKWFAG